METSPIMVDWDNGSSCWTLGRETEIGGCVLKKTGKRR